jgi:hypothetical protein
MIVDLSDVSTPKLIAIRQILAAGVISKAELSSIAQREQLCHKSPPKGYPKDKSDYGDPECYRYPLNTKSRCLAAWRYVHHADNKSILGGKFKSIESKIKSYAKKHYSLDLEVGESEEFDWAQAFVEYYDGETMGERCENIVLEEEIDNKMEMNEKIASLETENATLKSEKETWLVAKTDLETKASQVDVLTKELNDQKKELDNLRKFKSDTEQAAEKAERIKNIKSKLEEAGIDVNFGDDAEINYWLSMSDEVLGVTIAKMGELKKGAKASASKKIEVPNITNDETDPVKTVRDGFKELKNKK